MPRPLKLLLGAAATTPLLLTAYLLVRVFAAVFDTGRRHGAAQQNWLQRLFDEAFAIQLVALGLTVVLLGYCLWHLRTQHARRQGAQSVAWMVALMVLPLVTIPVYWWVVIWPEGEAEAPRARDDRTA